MTIVKKKRDIEFDIKVIFSVPEKDTLSSELESDFCRDLIGQIFNSAKLMTEDAGFGGGIYPPVRVSANRTIDPNVF